MRSSGGFAVYCAGCGGVTLRYFVCLFVCLFILFFSKHTVGPVLLDFYLQSLVGNSCVQMLYYLFDFYRFSLFALFEPIQRWMDEWINKGCT